MTSHAIVFYGDLVTDVVINLPRLPIEPNKVQRIRAITIEPGGAGNSLITAARLGAHAAALGCIGEDGNGEQVYQILRAEGVDVSRVQRGADTTNMSVFVFVDDAGQHVFLVHEGAGPPLNLGPAETALIRNAAAFFMPGYALHEPRVGEQALPAMEIALAAGVPIFSDLGPIVGDRDLRDRALTVLRHSQVALLTEEEALKLSEAADGETAARWMQAQGAQHIVIKRGGEGCSVFVGVAPRVDIAGIPVEMRDTSGAGDSFAAGFIVDLLKHDDIVRAARFANAVGAAKVQKLGTGRQMPTLEEVMCLVRE
jgi:ribokinase